MTEWNIDGIAQEVMKEMREYQAPVDDCDDYVHEIAYLTVYSRDPSNAKIVAEQVKQLVLEKYEDE